MEVVFSRKSLQLRSIKKDKCDWYLIYKVIKRGSQITKKKYCLCPWQVLLDHCFETELNTYLLS